VVNQREIRLVHRRRRRPSGWGRNFWGRGPKKEDGILGDALEFFLKEEEEGRLYLQLEGGAQSFFLGDALCSLNFLGDAFVNRQFSL